MKRAVVSMVLLLLLTGCGVRPTGVVSAGEPAVGIGEGPFLYFLADGQLRPVLRKTGQLGDVDNALGLLGAGPTAEEVAAGLNTLLPATGFSATAAREGVIAVRLYSAEPVGPAALPQLALDQVVCTAVAVTGQAGANARGLMVRLSGAGVPADETPVRAPR